MQVSSKTLGKIKIQTRKISRRDKYKFLSRERKVAVRA
jgi:hypothetical protein